MARHAPSHRRELLRRLKSGEHPVDLLDEARSIQDPGHAAGALMHIAHDPRTPLKKALPVLDEARRLLLQVDRPTRIGEAWGDVLALLAHWHPGHGEHDKDRLVDAAVSTVEAMRDGSWTRDAINALAPHVGKEGRQRLLRRALANEGFETDAKQILNAASSREAAALKRIIAEAGGEAAPKLVARLGDSETAVTAAWAIDDATARHEALRVLLWQAESAEEVEAIARTAHDRPAFDRVMVLTMAGARLDRMGHPRGKEHLQLAQRLLDGLEGKEQAKATRKLATAMERAGMAAPQAPERIQEEVLEVPVGEAKRSSLALVNTYTGGLGAPHIRAVARAAPLCKAFGLDLVLVDFPGTCEDLVAMVDADSEIGEGEGYARRMLEAQELYDLPLVNGLPEAWPGRPVATTPRPDLEKAKDLLSLEAPVCLLMGVGRQGLPKRMLHAAQVHYELTGKGISLETATAMGVLAERLGRLGQ